MERLVYSCKTTSSQSFLYLNLNINNCGCWHCSDNGAELLMVNFANANGKNLKTFTKVAVSDSI